MTFHLFPCDPPTPSSLANARRLLDESNSSLADLDRKIEAAEAQLAQIMADSRCTIKQLQRERATLEEKISRTLAYMSPIRRLPAELLRQIFTMNFDEYPCCAWILSSVCSQWRRLALSMPKLWSKVCYLSLSAFPPWFFFVGALWAKLGYLQNISAHFPTEPPCSIALSHVRP
jgi:F-box-like